MKTNRREILETRIAPASGLDAAAVRNPAGNVTDITATRIGHDPGGDTVFDFTNAGAAGFGLGDTALDGLVIVKLGGFDPATIPAVPLLKIEV